MKYNHNRELDSFQKEINLLKKNKFNPIAVSQMYMEDVFVFNTPEEANDAYTKFELNTHQIVAWWYGKDDFLNEVNEYEKNNHGYSKVKIIWLNE